MKKTSAKLSPRKVDEYLYDDIEIAWQRERPDLDLRGACVLLRLERANRLHEGRVQSISQRIGINSGELNVLLALRRAGAPYELRPTDLFRALLVTSGAMTKQIGRLQERGLVLRVSANQDGRSELVRLTAKGIKTADRSIEEVERVVKRVLHESGLDEREIDSLDVSLRKLLKVKP